MSEIPGLFQSLEEASVVYLGTPVSRASMLSHVVRMLRAHCYSFFFISIKFARVVFSISRQVQSASVEAAAQKIRLRGSGFVFTTLLVSLRYWLLGGRVVTPPPSARALPSRPHVEVHPQVYSSRSNRTLTCIKPEVIL